MNFKELQTAYAQKISSAKAIADSWTGKSSEMPADEVKKIDQLLSEADELKAKLIVAEKLASNEAFLNEPAGTKAAHEGWRQAGPNEGDAPVDAKAWRELSVDVVVGGSVIRKNIRYNVPLAVQGKGYDAAFDAYIRKGRNELGPADRKTLTEGVDNAGGYLVPEEWQSSVIRKIVTIATVRLYARVISTMRDIVKWPRVKYTTNNEYTSGIRMTWTGEQPSSATAHRVTDQVFGEIAIPVHTAMASQLISADLLTDSAFDVFGLSADLMGEAFALGENETFWSGTGAGQPRGIITDASDTTNWDAAITAAEAANAISAQDVIDVAYALPAQYERNARWFMTKATEKAVRSLADTDGQYLWPILSSAGGFGPAPSTLLGFPTSRDEAMNDISTASITPTYPLVFGDLSGYVIVDRAAMSLQRFDEIYSESNQVLLLAKKRVGGQLAEAYRLSLLKTGNSS